MAGGALQHVVVGRVKSELGVVVDLEVGDVGLGEACDLLDSKKTTKLVWFQREWGWC